MQFNRQRVNLELYSIAMGTQKRISDSTVDL